MLKMGVPGMFGEMLPSLLILSMGLLNVNMELSTLRKAKSLPGRCQDLP